MSEQAGHSHVSLLRLVREAARPVLLLAALDCAWFMLLPLLVWALVDASLGAILPLLAGTAIDLIRMFARQRVRRTLRQQFMVRTAKQALWKSTAIPEVRADSAFWGAHIAEYGVSLDAPGIIGAGIAAATTLVFSATRLGVGATLEVGTVLLCAVLLGVLSNRWRRREVNAIVDTRQLTATWMAAAMRDNGELASPRATGRLLAAVERATAGWCSAEDTTERKRSRHRLLIGALAGAALYALALRHGLDPLANDATLALFSGSLAGTMLLVSCFPAAYAFAAHLESFTVASAELARLALGTSERRSGANIRLSGRPTRLQTEQLAFHHDRALALDLGDVELPLLHPLGIAGPNGSGKTTLATLLAGVREPTAGAVRLDGIPAIDLSRDDVAFVPQDPVLVDALTIAENLALVAADFDPGEARALLQSLGLDSALDVLTGNLSRGEQRRIAIARALLKRPKLLVLDEPDAWLDQAGRRALLRALNAIAHETTVFVVSHRPDLLVQLEMVLILNERHELEAAGHPRELPQMSPTFRKLIGADADYEPPYVGPQ